MSAVVLGLRNLPDAERDLRVNEAVAVHCAGWMLSARNPAYGFPPGCSMGDRPAGAVPQFATSLDAVLPLLQKVEWWHLSRSAKCGARCEIMDSSDEGAYAEHADPVICACICLLRANGVTVLV